MKKLVVLAVTGLILGLGQGACLAADVDAFPEYTIMRPDPATMLQWFLAQEAMPKAPMVPEGGLPLPTASLSLLSHLDYVPAERNQGACGNCWCWAGHGCMEILLDTQNGVFDRLSVQYMNSCESAVIGKACCSGGWLSDVASFYSTAGYQQAVPWSNSGANWQDGDKSCDTPCGSVTVTPNYPVQSISAVSITTHGVTHAQAVANIKAILNQGKPVAFSFFMATTSDWNTFKSFWNNQSESLTFNPDYACGHTADSGYGGHEVLCIGYNDDNPSDPYWIMVNSWGSPSGRPNDIFHVSMNMDNNCDWYQGQWYYSYYWEYLDVSYVVGPPPNDTCAGATAISSSTYANIQSTAGATSTGDPVPTCVAGGKGVWYEYTAPENANGQIVVDTIGSGFDTVLTAYTGTCGSLTEVACDDDGGVGHTSKITMPVTFRTTYYFLAGGYYGDSGNLAFHTTFTPTVPPLNDNWAQSHGIGLPVSLTGINFGATTEPYEQELDRAGATVWWYIQPAVSGTLTIDTFGSDFDTMLHIFTDWEYGLANLIPVANNNDAGGTYQSQVTFLVNAGQYYEIRVGGYDGAQGNIHLNIGAVVPSTVTAVTVTATDAIAGEPATGQGTGTFTFSRAGSTASPLTAYYTVGGTATPGIDYTDIGTSVSFAAGSATATKTVSVIDDNLVEGDETVVVTLAAGAGYAVGYPAMDTVTIQDDDATVTVAATDATAGEPGTGQGTGTFTFTRTGYTAGALTVNYTVGGTATSGSDYTAIGTSVDFAAGSATATKTVSVIDDNLVEGDETVVVTLAAGTGYAVGSPSTATVTIQDDDATVSAAGTVAYYPSAYLPNGLSATRVGNVTMSLTGDASQSVVTLIDGSYTLNNIPVGGTYCVTPSKTDDSPTADGVDVLDLIAIARHIVNVAPLASPYKFLAADVNADENIDIIDLLAIAKLIVEPTGGLPAGLWRFVPADYAFLNPHAPWDAPTNRWYTNLVADVTAGDFVAIKLGDVDNSWTAPSGAGGSQARRARVLAKSAQGPQAPAKNAVPEVVFGVNQQSAQPGQIVAARVTVSGFSQVSGAQFTLAWDPAVLRYVGTGSYGARGLSGACFGTTLTEGGKLTFAWYDPGAVGVTLADGTVFFTVSFEVIGKAGSVSAVALTGSPTAQAVCVDVARAPFGAQDGSVAVVGPGVLVRNSAYAKGVFRLSVPTEQGRSYTLEFTDSLTPANWTALPAVTGDGTVKVLVDPAATNHQRFYRVHVR